MQTPNSQYLSTSGYFFKKLHVNPIVFSWLKRRFTFFYIIDFMFFHGDEVKYLGKDLFVESKFNVPFRLRRIEIEKIDGYFKEKNTIKFSCVGTKNYATLKGLKFRLPFPSGIIELKETFVEEIYNYFNVKEKVVLDVGAFIGDTAIYFALKGANKVIAYEPVPLLYEMAVENIELNNQKATIQIINSALGKNEGSIEVNYDEGFPGRSTVCDYYKQENIMHPQSIYVKMASFASVGVLA